MKFKIRLITSLTFLCVAISPLASAQDFMSEQEMLEVFSGATISAPYLSNKNKRWTQVYEEIQTGQTQGSIKGDSGGIPYSSKWFIRKGKWCENWGTGNGCYDLVREDDKTIRAYEKGSPFKIAWEII